MPVAAPERGSELFDALDTLDIPPGFRAEILKEEITLSPTPVGKHQRTMMELLWQLKPVLPTAHDIEVNLEIRIEHLLRSTIPDLFVAPYDVLDTSANHIPPDDVALVSEVVSTSNAANDRELKLGIYAAAHIPLYLLIDPIRGTATLYRTPEGGEYREQETVTFGKPLTVPAPFSFDLDTGVFRSY